MRKPSSITWLLAAARLIGSNPLPRTALIAGAALAVTVGPLKATTPYSLTSIGEVSQNFNTMLGTSATASITSGWGVTAAGGGAAPNYGTNTGAATTHQASSGSPNTGGIYNWGNGTTDRALGFMTSGGYASPNAILFGFTNNTGSTLGSISLSFNFERYRINSSAAAVTFFTSTNGTTWTANTAGDSGAFATGSSAYNFATGTTVNKSLTIAGLDLAIGSSYYLRWTFNTSGSNSQGIGLDDFVMSQTAATTPLFWAGPGWTANGAGGSGTWDGTGNWDATKANFGGTAGTVTVGTVNATGLSFSNTTSAYTLNSGTITLTGATVSVTNGAVSATINSVLAGAVGFTKAGAGALTIGGANSYTGATNVDAGSLTTSGGAGRLGSANALSVATGATLALGGNESATTVTNTGAIDLGANTLTSGGGTSVGNFSGTGGSLIFSGSATLSGTNNYTGGTTVNAGTLTVSTTTALPTAGAIVINAASQLKLNVSGTFGDPGQTLTLNADQATNPILGTLSAAAITLQSNVVLATGTTNRIEPSSSTAVLTLAGNLTGAGNLSKAASGNLTLSGTANTNTGTTQIGNGTITVNSGSALGTGSLTFFQTSTNAPTIALNNATQSVGTLTSSWTALTGTIAQTLTLNGTALTINQNSDSTFGAGAVSTLSSVITGTGSIIKTGAGTLTLSSTNTFTGGTTISSGTLQVGAGGATGSLAGAITNNAALVFNHSGPITADNLISGTGSVTKQGAGTLTLSGANTYTGTSTISAGTLLVGHLTALGTGAVTVNGGTLDLNTANLGGQIANVITVTSGSVIGGIAASAADTAGTVAVTSGADRGRRPDQDHRGYPDAEHAPLPHGCDRGQYGRGDHQGQPLGRYGQLARCRHLVRPDQTSTRRGRGARVHGSDDHQQHAQFHPDGFGGYHHRRRRPPGSPSPPLPRLPSRARTQHWRSSPITPSLTSSALA